LKFGGGANENDPRRFAPLGLVLSLLAIISLVVLLIIKGLASGGVFTLPRSKSAGPGHLDQHWCDHSWAGRHRADRQEGTRKFFVGRQVQYGSNSLIMLLAFLVLCSL